MKRIDPRAQLPGAQGAFRKVFGRWFKPDLYWFICLVHQRYRGNLEEEIYQMEIWLEIEREKMDAGQKSHRFPKTYKAFIHRWLRKCEHIHDRRLDPTKAETDRVDFPSESRVKNFLLNMRYLAYDEEQAQEHFKKEYGITYQEWKLASQG